MLKLDYRFNEIKLTGETPLWADKIKRWSQLDSASYVLAEATFLNLDYLKDSFDQLIVVSTQGSSSTDRKFVSDTKISPSHFVHTLPNVRTIVFSLLTGWEGEMYCLTKGEESLVNFLKSAPVVDGDKSTLVISMNSVGEFHQCDFYKLGRNLSSAGFEFTETSNAQSIESDFSLREKILSDNMVTLSESLSLRKVH